MIRLSPLELPGVEPGPQVLEHLSLDRRQGGVINIPLDRLQLAQPGTAITRGPTAPWSNDASPSQTFIDSETISSSLRVSVASAQGGLPPAAGR